jgi:hypothetical protein
MRWPLAAVFLLSLLALGYQAHHTGVASGYVDPVGRIRAQDEAVYAHTALRMARTGDWLTPNFLGRHALYKPPLLFWTTGLSVKLLGASPLSLRLPSLLAGALAATLLFAWLRRSAAPAAAAAAVLLLISNPLWHRVSRMCLTDALLALWIIAALFVLARDPRLQGRRALWSFSAFTAAAILTKGIAGLLPLGILALFAAFHRTGERPSLRRILQAGLLTAALALPWHVYQLLAHPRWFWAEYVQGEILTFGLGSPYQTSAENHALFYLRRLALTDPLLCLLALAALPSLIAAWRAGRSHPPALLISWITAAAAAMMLFQYRNASYLSLLVPVLALASVAYGRLFSGRRAALAAAVLAMLFFLRAAFPSQPWGLNFRTGTDVAAAPLLEAYARMHRPNDLILVSPNDEFYSAVLPLPRVRYCFIDPRDPAPAYGLDFRHLGISVTAAQFAQLDQWRSLFRERLRAFHLNSEEPIATVIVVPSVDELVKMIAASPRSDFLLPASLRGAVEPRTETSHRMLPASPQRFLLLARH